MRKVLVLCVIVLMAIIMTGCGKDKLYGKWKISVYQNKLYNSKPFYVTGILDGGGIYVDNKKKGSYSIDEETNTIEIRLDNVVAIVPEINLSGKIVSDTKLKGKSVKIHHAVRKELDGTSWKAEKIKTAKVK